MKRDRFLLVLLMMKCTLLACAKGNVDSSSPEHSATHPFSYQPFQWDQKGCSTWNDPINQNQIDFCYQSTQAISPVGKTLYAFHGMGVNPKDFCDSLGRLRGAFERSGSISHLICPSFGPNWAIHENRRYESFARFQLFMQQTQGASSILKPVLYGESMGGFNSIKLFGTFNSSPPAFEKVGVSCPAIFSKRLPPRYRESELPPSLFGGFAPGTSLSIIQDSPYFDTSAIYPELDIFANLNDPIGRDSFSLPGTPLNHLGGIYQGARDFYFSLQKRGLAAHFRDLPGGHCEHIPMEEMIGFLGK